MTNLYDLDPESIYLMVNQAITQTATQSINTETLTFSRMSS